MSETSTETLLEPAVDAPEGPAPRIATTTRAATETVIGAVIWSYLWALILNTTLNLMHTSGDVKYMIGFTVRKELAGFAISTTVVWVIVLLVLCISGRLWLTCALTLSAVIGIGLVDQTKMQIRLEPVYPSDLDFLRSPGFLFAMVSPGRLVLAGMGMGLIVAIVLLLGRVPRRTFLPIRRQATPTYWRNVVIARLAAAVTCLVALNYAMSFNQDDNRLRQAYEASGTKWAFWYQDVNYTRNGFVAGMLYNLLASPMAPPEGYSQKTMDEVAARWQTTADQINSTRTTDLSDVNVISVLSEAFSDPTTVTGTTIEDDPIPFTRDLMTRTTSGTMLAQLYGGGTANMEFETLSGQSLSVFEPQVNTPYQQFVPNQPGYSTIVGYLKADGHRAIAIHPYITAMYQRKPVYKNFGIEDFIHDTTMHATKKIDDAQFISDESAFEEVTRQLASISEPLFVNLVTMQNHVPTAEVYQDPWPVTVASEPTAKAVAGYARGLNYSDKALQKLLQRLAASDEKTAVVFYGDHRPGIYPTAITDKNTDLAMKSTPFFIWTNFKTPVVPTAALTSPIYFMPLLFEQIGAKVPPFYALLTELYKKIPAMEQGVRFDWDGGDAAVLDARAQMMLDDYRLIQYDLSVGKRYAAAELFYPLTEDSR